MSPLPSGQIPVGGLLRSTYLDQNGDIGAVLDYDEVSDVPTFVIDGDVLLISKVPGQPNTQLRFVGSVQRPYQALGIAVRDDASFVEADFGTIDTSPDDEVEIPPITGNQYLALWYAADALEINVVQILGSRHNHRDEFGSPVALEVGGNAGFYIASNNALAAARGGTKILAYNLTGLSTFVRRSASRLSTDGNDFTAADFTGANGASSTTGVVPLIDRTDGSHYYHAFAVPSAQNPITGILTRGFSGFEQEIVSQFEEQAGGLTIAGVAHRVWRSTSQYNRLGFAPRLIRQNPTL